jgi:hypothetical protein
MKNIFLVLLGAVALTGCMHRYDVTLTNGMKITHVSKPKLDKQSGLYVFKNIKGQKEYITAARVIEIAPHSDEKSPKSSPPVTPH